MRQRSVYRSIALVLIILSVGSPSAGSPPDPPYLVLQTGPEESVTSVAVSPDGSLVATGGERVRIYDARTGELRRVIGSDPSRGVRTLAFAPDGATIMSGGLEMDRTLKQWDVRTGALARAVASGHDTMGQLYAEIHSVDFAPGGKLVASAGRDGRVVVWDIEAGRVRHRLEAHRGEALALAIAPGGGTLASGGEDRAIRLWDVASGRLLRVLEGHRDAVRALDFSPDGKTLASGGSDWAVHRGRDPSRITGRGDGRGEWKLWDTATGAVLRTVTEPDRVPSLAFAPDGGTLACAVGRDVRLYDLRSEGPGRTVTSHDGAVTSLAFAPDGQAIISGSHDRTARRVRLPAGEEEWRARGYWEQVNSVAISRDGRAIVTGSSDLRFALRQIGAGARRLGPGAVRLWDARTGRLLRRLGDPAHQILAVALSPDGRRIAAAGAVASGSGAVRLWDAETGAPVWSADDHTATALALAFAPDGSALATADADGLI